MLAVIMATIREAERATAKTPRVIGAATAMTLSEIEEAMTLAAHAREVKGGGGGGGGGGHGGGGFGGRRRP